MMYRVGRGIVLVHRVNVEGEALWNDEMMSDVQVWNPGRVSALLWPLQLGIPVIMRCSVS